MAVVLQMDFPTTGPWGPERTAALRERAGGIYLFADADSALAYRDMHLERLAATGVTDVRVILFDVNDDLSAITLASGPTLGH